MHNIELLSEKLHTAVTEATESVRRILNDHNIGHMRLDIEITGRVNAGDIKIGYKLGDLGYAATSPEAYCLAATVAEFLRRKNWEKRNAPIALSAPKANDDDAPAKAPRAVDVAQF